MEALAGGKQCICCSSRSPASCCDGASDLHLEGFILIATTNITIRLPLVALLSMWASQNIFLLSSLMYADVPVIWPVWPIALADDVALLESGLNCYQQEIVRIIGRGRAAIRK